MYCLKKNTEYIAFFSFYLIKYKQILNWKIDSIQFVFMMVIHYYQ